MRRPAVAAGSVTAVLLALVAVVLASRGEAGDRTAAAYDAAPVRNVVFAVLAFALVGSTILAVWALWPDGRGEPKPPPKTRLLPYLVLLGLVLAIAVVAPERPDVAATGEDPPTAEPIPPEDDDGEDDDAGFGGRASARASLLLVAAATVALLAATAVFRRRALADLVDDTGEDDADQPHEAREPALPDALRTGVAAGDLDAAVAAVRAEVDPRRAALLAYAVLDAHLAGTPAARPTAATPHEWLRRIRTHDPATADPATRLTALYERARFSVAPMTSGHREEAAAALQALPRRAVRT